MKRFLLPCAVALASPATGTPPPPPPGEVHFGRLGSACDGRYADGQPFREYRLRSSPGQRYALALRSHDMDAVLFVLDSPTSNWARLSLFSERGAAAVARFQASESAPRGEMTIHEYVLRVQGRPGQLGTFKIEVIYDPASSEIFSPGEDPARRLASLERDGADGCPANNR